MRSKRTFYNIFSSLLLKIVIIINGLIIPNIIIKNFGSNVNGLISSITQFLGYITLLEAGVGPVIKSLLYKPIAQNDLKQVSNILIASEKFFRNIALIFICYLFLFSIIYPNIINTEFSFIYVFSLILILSISTFAEYYFGIVYNLFLQAQQKNYVVSIIQIITYILTILGVIILIKLNFSIHIVKLFSCLILLLRPLLQYIYVCKKCNFKINNYNSNYKLKNKWDGLAQHIVAVVHNNTDVAVLTIFSTLSEVSVYSIYYLIVSGIKSIIQAFTGGIDAIFGDMIAKKEDENLNVKFELYEILYDIIITIFYSCTLLLIVPFVSVYTQNINDTNYIRPLFGTLLVISEFIWAIRLPYSTITLAAGHFKETKVGAWIEAITNLLISIILVHKLGIIGVAIGTIIAMTIRTIEFVFHTNKYILKRNIWKSLKKIILIIIETLLIIKFSHFIFDVNITSYLDWIKYSIIIFSISLLVVSVMNLIFYKKQLKKCVKIFKNILNKKGRKND